MKNITTLLTAIETAVLKGAKFIAFDYRAKKTGELARYTLQLNVNINRVVREDVATLFASRRDSAIGSVEWEARRELVKSFCETARKGAGNNSRYTKKDLYSTVGGSKGAMKLFTDGTLEIFGFQRNRKVIEAGEYKTVNSRPKTIAKNKLRKGLKYPKFRTLCVDADIHKPETIKVEGEVISLG